jgi:hypothetical protein
MRLLETTNPEFPHWAVVCLTKATIGENRKILELRGVKKYRNM